MPKTRESKNLAGDSLGNGEKSYVGSWEEGKVEGGGRLKSVKNTGPILAARYVDGRVVHRRVWRRRENGKT